MIISYNDQTESGVLITIIKIIIISNYVIKKLSFPEQGEPRIWQTSSSRQLHDSSDTAPYHDVNILDTGT